MKIRESLKPLYIFTKLFGHCPYKFDGQKKVYTYDIWTIAYSVLFSLTSCLPFFFKASFNSDTKNQLAYTYSYEFFHYSEMIILNVNILINCLKVRKIIRILRSLEEVDEELGKITEEPIDSRPIYIVSIIGLFIFSADAISRAVGEFLMFFDDAFYYCLSNFWNAVLMDLFKIQFCVIMFIPLTRFRRLNSFFENMRITENGSPTTEEKQLDMIEKIHALHSKLCSICLDINDIFSIPTLLVYLYAVSATVVEIYFTFLRRANWNWHVAAQILVILHWSAFRIFSLVMVAFLYHCILKQAAKMKRAIHKLLQGIRGQKLKAALEIFALHEMNRNLEFTVCGLFSVDFRMIQMAFATIATYVVMLIQLRVAK